MNSPTIHINDQAATASPDAAPKFRQTPAQSSTGIHFAAGIALAVVTVHLLTNGRYGFHRDELQTLSDALHLDWGFVVYPPFTPFVERSAMSLFGLSLVGLRLFSVIAQAFVVIVTAMMARELGGSRWAQAAAALAVATAAVALFEGTEFQYTSFDNLWWVLAAYFVIRLLKTAPGSGALSSEAHGQNDASRWCLAIGATVGIGLQTKYTMAFFLAGILVGFLLTPARRFFASRWFWAGAGLALLIFLPNLIWQVRHDFVSLHFLEHIHVRDVAQGRANDFWRSQLLSSQVVGIVGLFACLFNRRYRRFQTLAWMCLVPVIVLWLAKGRGYYTAAAYPMMIAMGACAIETRLARRTPFWRGTVKIAYAAVFCAWGIYVATLLIPLATSGPLMQRALRINGDLREEIGWTQLVQTVAAIRDSLPPEQRQDARVLVGNYGEQGAIELLGRPYNLQEPLSGTNSAWYRSYPHQPPSALIVLGFSRKQIEESFNSCRLAGHNDSQGVHNEESDDHPDIYVCDRPRLPWPEFWKEFRRFG